MKTLFFTESPHMGKVPRDYKHMRVEYAWQYLFDSVHIPLTEYESFCEKTDEVFDISFFIIPKGIKRPFDIELIRNKGKSKRIVVIQEGPRNWWQDLPTFLQLWYIRALSVADWVLAHNKIDAKYFSGLLNTERVSVIPTTMVDYPLQNHIDCIKKNRDVKRGVIVGGNLTSWYGGMDSVMIGVELSEDGVVHVPTMGRRQSDEEQISNLRHIPHLSWDKWMVELSKFKYAIHLMPTFAAGTFAMNCAYLGIPCIGYKGLDTQEICFPELSIDLGDLRAARKIAMHLKREPRFYESCSVYAQSKFQDTFSEAAFQNFIEEFRKNLEL